MTVEALWREVLLIALTDALHGIAANASIDDVRRPMDARDYILVPNPDFTLVCSLADLEPEAVRSEFAARLAQLGSARPPRTWRDLTADAKPKLPSEPSYTYQGRSLSLREWAEVSGMPRPLLMNRVNRRGWPIERALTQPVGRRMPKPSRSDQEQVRRILRELGTFETDAMTGASS